MMRVSKYDWTYFELGFQLVATSGQLKCLVISGTAFCEDDMSVSLCDTSLKIKLHIISNCSLKCLRHDPKGFFPWKTRCPQLGAGFQDVMVLVLNPVLLQLSLLNPLVLERCAMSSLQNTEWKRIRKLNKFARLQSSSNNSANL